VTSAAPATYPRHLLIHLLKQHNLSPGARVLELGCGTGELTRALHEFSLDVTAYERSANLITQATEALPEVDFQLWPEHGDLPEAEQSFDLVLVRDAPQDERDLLAASSLQWTAEAASWVRPGGHLVNLVRLDPTWQDQPGGHLMSCYQRLFSCFPGDCQTKLICDPLTDRKTWAWILGRRPRSGFLAVSFQTPQLSIARQQWQQTALREIAHPREPCCLWARRQLAAEKTINRAA
jgi:SAM-dependent methyltransferase